MLLPTLRTWAVNGLEFQQRGRGTGIWTGTLFIGQFLTPIVLGAAAAALGSFGFALGALGILPFPVRWCNTRGQGSGTAR